MIWPTSSSPALFELREREASENCSTMHKPTMSSSRVTLLRMSGPDIFPYGDKALAGRARSSTERQREYRARKRAERAALRQANGEAEPEKKQPLSGKERARLNRARRKAAAAALAKGLAEESSNTATDEVTGEPQNATQNPAAPASSGAPPTVIEVIRQTPTSQPIVASADKTQPKGAYSLLKRNSAEVAQTSGLILRSEPSILRKSEKIYLVRGDEGQAPKSSLQPPGTSKPDPRNIVARVPCASTSNGASAPGVKLANGFVTCTQVGGRTIIKFPTCVKQEPRPPHLSKQPIVRKILVRRTVPLYDNSRGTVSTVESTPRRAPQENPENPPSAVDGSMSTGIDAGPPQSVPMFAAPAQEQSVDVSFIKTEAPEGFIVENFDPPSVSTMSATSDIESAMQTDSVEEPYFMRNSVADTTSPAGTMDHLLDDISRNLGCDSERFYMVSHESLMTALSTCNICASAADVTLQRKGASCEASIKCRLTEEHNSLWDGEKRGNRGKHDSRGQGSNFPESQTLRPFHDIPWSLILMCLIAKIVDIPIKKLERFCRLFFAANNIGAKLQAASSLTASFLTIHALTKPKLERPMDHLKLIVICRKLLVFLDPFTYSPLACFEFRGSKLWSTSCLSSALNIGLQRLQLLNSNKFSRVDVVHSSPNVEEPEEWKPLLVPDMDLMYEEALTCILSALWQNKYEFDMKSVRLRGILEDITKALCFFQPEAATMREEEARSHFSLVLSDLSRIHDRRFVPRLDEIALLKNTFQCLPFSEYKAEIGALIAEIKQLNVYSILNSLYEKTISTAVASYVVDIRNEEPCKATHKVMEMIEMCEDEELSVETALRVLMLLPARSSPSDVIDNVFRCLWSDNVFR